MAVDSSRRDLLHDMIEQARGGTDVECEHRLQMPDQFV